MCGLLPDMGGVAKENSPSRQVSAAHFGAYHGQTALRASSSKVFRTISPTIARLGALHLSTASERVLPVEIQGAVIEIDEIHCGNPSRKKALALGIRHRPLPCGPICFSL